MNRLTFLVWDHDDMPPLGEWVPVLWRGFGKGGDVSVYSIPRLVEEQADTLRARFLGWIYDLGEAQIHGQRLVDRLAIRPGFSYWWMTLLAEKCNFAKSPQIYDTVRLLALEGLVSAHPVGKIILASGDKTLVRVFRDWCEQTDRVFEWHRLADVKYPVSWMRRLYGSLPHPAQALMFLLRYLRQRWPLKQSVAFPHSSASAEITFVDYLAHLNPTAFATGRYASNYWTNLLGQLDRDAVRVNWLHHYVDHAAVSTTQKAQELIARFNQNSSGSQFHAPLDGVLAWPAVRDAACDYARIVLMGMRLRKIQPHFRLANSRINLWPLFEPDWNSSIFGATAILNCLFLNLFEHTLKGLPRQKLGVYLQENQGWEAAFIHAWKAAGHGSLIGVSHTTVRYWDLRLFHDPRNYLRRAKNDLPMPDMMALNGTAALKAHRNGGCPESQMVEVEALRFLYLSAKGNIKNKDTCLSYPLRVLVCGDILPAANQQMMRWLASAVKNLPENTRYTVKSHPVCAIKASDYPSLKLHMTNAPLAELLTSCDVVFTSNVTSAAVDAYCTGIPVVQVLSGNSFNMSPLRGLKGVVYVTNPDELAVALGDAERRECILAEPYFCLDNELPRWRKLLGLR